MTIEPHGKLRVRSLLWLVSAALLGTMCSSVRAEDAKYSGKANVDDVGVVAFPPGQWVLEASRIQKDANVKNQQREYFVFRRADADAERLTIVRYNPIAAVELKPPSELIYYENFRFGDGLPDEARKKGADFGDIRVRSDVKHSDRQVECTFVTAYEKSKETWLCHTTLLCRHGWIFVLVHASTRVIDPQAVYQTMLASKLRTDLPKGLFVIPPKLVGEWRSPDRDFTTLYLASDGKCVWSSGGIDVMSAAMTGFYEASSHTLSMEGFEYRVDEKALTMTPVRGHKNAVASGMDQKFRKSKTESPFGRQMVESLYGDP